MTNETMSKNERVLSEVVIEMQNRITKLKSLILLTDPAVSDQVMNPLSQKQWEEYVKCFPYEGRTIEY